MHHKFSRIKENEIGFRQNIQTFKPTHLFYVKMCVHVFLFLHFICRQLIGDSQLVIANNGMHIQSHVGMIAYLITLRWTKTI